MRVRIAFTFKGQEYLPGSDIDLGKLSRDEVDDLMERGVLGEPFQMAHEEKIIDTPKRASKRRNTK